MKKKKKETLLNFITIFGVISYFIFTIQLIVYRGINSSYLISGMILIFFYLFLRFGKDRTMNNLILRSVVYYISSGILIFLFLFLGAQGYLGIVFGLFDTSISYLYAFNIGFILLNALFFLGIACQMYFFGKKYLLLIIPVLAVFIIAITLKIPPLMRMFDTYIIFSLFALNLPGIFHIVRRYTSKIVSLMILIFLGLVALSVNPFVIKLSLLGTMRQPGIKLAHDHILCSTLRFPCMLLGFRPGNLFEETIYYSYDENSFSREIQSFLVYKNENVEIGHWPWANPGHPSYDIYINGKEFDKDREWTYIIDDLIYSKNEQLYTFEYQETTLSLFDLSTLTKTIIETNIKSIKGAIGAKYEKEGKYYIAIAPIGIINLETYTHEILYNDIGEYVYITDNEIKSNSKTLAVFKGKPIFEFIGDLPERFSEKINKYFFPSDTDLFDPQTNTPFIRNTNYISFYKGTLYFLNYSQHIRKDSIFEFNNSIFTVRDLEHNALYEKEFDKIAISECDLNFYDGNVYLVIYTSDDVLDIYKYDFEKNTLKLINSKRITGNLFFRWKTWLTEYIGLYWFTKNYLIYP